MKKTMLIIGLILTMTTTATAQQKVTEADLLSYIKGRWYYYGTVYDLDLSNGRYEIAGKRYPMKIEGYDLQNYRVAIAATMEGKVQHFIIELRQRDMFTDTGIIIQRTKGRQGGQRMEYVGTLKQ